jgi:hypothetical protein
MERFPDEGTGRRLDREGADDTEARMLREDAGQNLGFSRIVARKV